MGIATMYDRALQALVKLALEPEWEALFSPNSYRFRPGRACHDGATRSRVFLTEEPTPPRDSFPSFPSKRVNDSGYVWSGNGTNGRQATKAGTLIA